MGDHLDRSEVLDLPVLVVGRGLGNVDHVVDDILDLRIHLGQHFVGDLGSRQCLVHS